MKQTKKIVAWLLALCILFGLLPMQAYAAFDETTYVTTGNQRDDIVAIARTQIGYCEGNTSSQLDGTVKGKNDYTKYPVDLTAAGYKASNKNPWCAYFVSWCALKAGCLGKTVLYTGGCGNYVVMSKPYRSKGLGTLHGVKPLTYSNKDYVKRPYTIPVEEDYIPRKGDFVLFSYEAGTINHVGLVIDNYNSKTGTFTYIDGNNEGKVWERTKKLSDSTVVAFYSPEYNLSAGHYHGYTQSYEAVHPHRNYKRCGCGYTYYINGSYTKVATCSQCYPLGNVVLTRSFSKTAKTATFYRNDVANANSYTLSLYKEGSFYNSYSMTSTSYTVSNLASGSYTATLVAKNTSTGGTAQASCEPFTIVNSFAVSYDANGGSGAPSVQEKIQDQDLTISTVKPTRAHYVFKGWAPTKTATEAVYEAGGTYSKNAKITLYAVWEPETYTVNFDANGGNGELLPHSITYGDTMRMPNSIVLSGSYLRGWGTSASSSTVAYRLGMDYKIDKNLNLYAVWAASAWANEIADSFAGGSGTEEDPYQISNASELAYLAHLVNSQTTAPEYKYYKLTDNIDFNFAEWVPIGLGELENQYFYGSFDGNGYTISNMSISEYTSPYIGLFGYVKDSEIKNLNFIGEIYQISSSEQMHIGAVVGYAKDSTISDCNVIYINVSGISATNTATKPEAFSNIGCIVGKQQGGVIKNCTADDCYMSFNSGSFNAGIIAGYSDGEITENKVTAEENLFGTGNSLDSVCLGGIVGTSVGTVEKCAVQTGHMSSTMKFKGGANIGGIVGNAEGKISLCSVQYTNQDKTDSVYAEGMTSSTGTELDGVHMGGVVGYMGASAELTDCKYDGMGLNAVGTNGDVGVGGLAGGIKTESASFAVNGMSYIDKGALPQKKGYNVKWYTDSDFTTPYDFNTWVTSDLTLYAKWEKEETLSVWDGSSSEPAYDASTMTYTVTNGNELAWIADVCKGVITTGTNIPSDKSFSGYTVVLAKDIALNDTSSWTLHNDPGAGRNRNWKVIGDAANPFKGTFDGQEHTIYGLYFSSDTSVENVGLFGCANGVIKNINISHAYLTPSGWNYGVIAGQFAGELTNCHNVYNVTINFTASDNDGGTVLRAGGIVGYMESGTVKNCSNSKYTKIYVTAGRTVGGIIGGTGETTFTYIYNCSNAASINANYNVGGIAGMLYGSVCYSYNSGEISYSNGNVAHGRIGGIIGSQLGIGVRADDCGNTGNVTGTGNSVGGIVGLYSNQSAEITSGYNIGCSYNKGNILLKSLDGGSYHLVGGIIGGIVGNFPSQSKYYAFISTCWNGGTVTNSTGGYCTGGIAGGNDSGSYNVAINIDYSSNTGAVSGYEQVGGLLGAGYGTTDINHYFSSSFNSGTVSGTNTYGGLAGYGVRFQFSYCKTTSSTLYHTATKVSNYDSTAGVALASVGTSGFVYDTSVYPHPYYKTLKDRYVTYNITTATETDGEPVLERSFANINGDLNSSSAKNASSGGILGATDGNGTEGSVPVINLLTIANGIYSGTSGSSYLASSGLIVGKNTGSAVGMTNTYAYSDTVVEAANSANASNIYEDSTCTETKPKAQITRLSFLKQVFGPTAYQSLDYLKEDATAVWVIKNGELPELYYNCLNDITISKEIEHGTITVDKTQAVDDEIVTITAVPDEGYEFNAFYVNGVEGVGTTFAVSGDSEIYAIFSPETAQYSVVLESNENASGSLSNADAVSTFSLRSTGSADSLTASDGEEILVSATSNEKYTIDSVCINGEEIAGNSFILTDDTTVSLTVTSIDTEVYAVTNDAENIGVYFADLSGSVTNGDENTKKYIRYWETENPDVVFTTEIETGSGAYEVTLDDLLPATSYSYQMLETGEVKTFTTLEDSDLPSEVVSDGITTETSYVTDGTNYVFTVSSSSAISTEIVYVAIYDEDKKLLALKQASFGGGTSASVEIPVKSGAVLAKIFVWDENYAPLKDEELKDMTVN